MRILVTGSRAWRDRGLIREVLRWLDAAVSDPVLIHGNDGEVDTTGCVVRGLDRMAGEEADALGWDVEPHDALWDLHGAAAGSLRNQSMVDAGADLCVAFPLPGSKGTWDCVARADEAGIPVVIVGSEEQKAPRPWRDQLSSLRWK